MPSDLAPVTNFATANAAGVPSGVTSGVEIDDCWNRIGVRGDNSCKRLDEYLHCRNCPVHADAAAALLDRPRPTGGDEVATDYSRITPLSARDERLVTTSVLVFRLGDEWLALPTSAFRQVTVSRPVHRLPHRTHPAVLGVVNIEGTLRACVSLARLLYVEAATAKDDTQHTHYPRMLVIEDPHGPVVFPVDEVDGVRRFATASLEAPPATVAGRVIAHARALIRVEDRTIGLLDVAVLLKSLERSLA
jgi:chemotaxis-related protein WspD